MKENTTCLIRLCVFDDVMNHILDLTTLKDVWEKLENQYMSKTLMNKLFSEQRLYSLEMQKECDLQAHVNDFNNILVDLARLGVKVGDEDKAIILMFSLPSSYDHLVTTLTHGRETITLDSISSTLLQHARYLQSVEEGRESSCRSLFVKEGQDRGRGKSKVVSSGNKKSF